MIDGMDIRLVPSLPGRVDHAHPLRTKGKPNLTRPVKKADHVHEHVHVNVHVDVVVHVLVVGSLGLFGDFGHPHGTECVIYLDLPSGKTQCPKSRVIS
jgi:hypothetical protein